MGKNKTFILFLKRFIKYFSILTILILMISPLFFKSYTLARQLTIDKSSVRLKDGINALESQVLKAQEITNLLQQEDSFRRLFFVKDAPSNEFYVDINTLQTKLKSLSLTQDMLSNVYVMFKENPIFVSNYLAADNYADVYDNYFHYRNMPIEEWHDLLFEESYYVKFLPAKPIFSSYYSHNYFDGITALINNSYYNSIDQKSILAFVFNRKDILNKILYEDEREEYFAYIADSENNILMSSNYGESGILHAVGNFDEITLGSEKYITLTYTSERLQLHAVVGIPSKIFKENVNSILDLVILYVIIGTLILVLLSFLFSMKETLWLKKWVEIASKSTNTIFNFRNEYKYIDNAITAISAINEEQLGKIAALNDSLQYSALKNLLILGVYTEREKEEVESYFHNKFDNFCVAKVNYRTDPLHQVDKTIQQYIVLVIENTFKSITDHEFVALNFLSSESVFVIFFDHKDASHIDRTKKQLTELIRAINANLQIPLSISIGLSHIAFDIKNAKTAYQQALYALSINENEVSSGVYVYEPIPEYVDKQVFDIAVLLKLYDAIIAGEKSMVAQIFSDSYKHIASYSLTRQEQLQIFFSLSQTIHNTMKVIVSEKLEADEHLHVSLPEYALVKDMIKLFTELQTVAMNLCDMVMNNKKSNNEKLKDNIVEYIHRNYADVALSASSIATELLISEKYVFSFVKEQTGKSLGKFIEEVRMTNAKRLLLETDYSNSKILQMCGFGSEKTFYRAFSKRHASSPTIWRDNNRNMENFSTQDSDT